MTRYSHIARAVAEMPWAIRPGMLAVIIDLLQFRMAGYRLTDQEVADRIGARRADRTLAQSGNGVAVIPIWGVIAPKAESFDATSSQGAAISTIRSQLRQAMADPEIGAVMLDIDSPGGQVDQVPELAAEIRDARGSKPIVAIANTDAASAAYWLGAQASEFSVTPSGQVGSVGVFSAHEDLSELQAKEGRKVSLVSAGKYKVEGNPFEPLTDEARAEIQARVDYYYNEFVHDLARGRGTSVETVRRDYGEGRTMTAKKALQQGMVDRIETFDQALTRTMRLANTKVPKAAAYGGTATYVDGGTTRLWATFDNGITTQVAASAPGNGAYVEHGERVTAALAEFVQRTQDRRAARLAADRELSAGDRQRLAVIRGELASLVPDLDALLAVPADEALSVYAEFLEADSRLPIRSVE
jgi:signal peptide peptidase SppA